MENDYFITTVNALKKPQEKRQLLQILNVIRKGIDPVPNKSQNMKILNETWCVKNIIGCLQLESCSVLDITLSILGNCCIDPNFSKNMVKLNALHSLNRVLDKHDKDSIVGRVFRIIGNLSDNVCSGMIILREPLLIDKIVAFLNKVSDVTENTVENISEATVIMGLRAIRKLLKKSTLEKLLINHQVLKSVGMVLIKYANEWELRNSSENILQDILRLLHIYSRYAHPHIIQSLKNTEKGDALVCLGKVATLNPSRVIKIITNLNRCCSLKSDLPVAVIWQKLLEKLKTDMNQSNYMECLRSMYKLVLHPCNREYMKLGDSVCQLINILKDFTVCTDFSMECCTLIFSMLSKCQYEDTLVLKQISFNIVNILIEKLEWSGIPSTSVIISHHVKRKRKIKRDLENNKKLKLILDCDPCNNIPDTSILHEGRCVSPSQLSEISSNGPNSPTTAAIIEDVSDSDNYSPVCSDAEDTDINSIPSLESLEPDRASSSDDEDIVGLNEKIKYGFLLEIIALLWRYSRVKPAIMDLGNPKLLIILMNIVLCNDCSNSSHELIISILRKPDYLIPLMQTDFIQMLYDLTFTEHDIKVCYSCNRIREVASAILNVLTKVAESGGGKGDIAHTLLRSNITVKDKIVIALPYIVRNRHIISKLLINCGGLEILLNLLEEKTEIHKKSIRGVCVLAIQQLKIKNPVNTQPRKDICNLNISNYYLSDACKNVVTFKLEDGNTVVADRDFLSDKSDYFNRLLNGSFMESEQSEITLQSISMKSLKFLLMLLHSNIALLGVVDIELNALLDLLEITERYLLSELNVYLTGCVEQLHMSSKTAPTIYRWSIESGTNILRVETIAYALVGDIIDADRLEMFDNLFNLGYSKQLRDDIEKLLLRFLR